MKLNRAYLTFAALIAIAVSGCKNDDPNDNSFDNKLYIDAESKLSTLMVKPSTITDSKVIRSSAAKPVEEQVDIVYKIDPQMVAIYNKAYYDNAQMLPTENYELVNNTATIPVGGVKSTDVTLNFKDLNTLDRKQIYVLPVSIESASNIKLLNSACTSYYLFKAGAVINVVANIRQNSLEVKWNTPSAVNRLNNITMEALIRVHSYDHILSIMGIEGVFLMRISDEGYPSNGLQIATSDGENFPSADKSPLLPTDKWVQIAMTMNAYSGEYIIYIDGENAVSGVGPQLRSINLTQTTEYGGFFIGKSYNDSRWLDGEIAECRIWSTIRSQAQIKAGRYEVDPKSPGLVAYWKFDEGAGSFVNDRTANGNNATAAEKLKWVKMTLPE